MYSRTLVGILAATAVAVAGCSTGGSSSSPAAGSAAATSPPPTSAPSVSAAASASSAGAAKNVNVTATEFKLVADATSVVSGEVTFTVTNKGAIAHEFVIVRTDEPPEALPTDDAGKVSETATTLASVDEVEDVTPGSSKTLTVTLTPGKYVFICNLPGHYAGGMHGGFVVSAG